MTPEAEIARFVHQANIAKYQKILTTYLTEHRRFVERRLAEEQAALKRLAGRFDVFEYVA